MRSLKEKIRKFFDFQKEDLPYEELKHSNPSISKVSLVDTIKSVIVSVSNNVDLVSDAAHICVGMQPFDSYDKKLNHVLRIVRRRHESVLEHTNVVMLISAYKEWYLHIIDLMNGMKYLNYKINYDESTDSFNILIGGSIRGYKYLFKTLKFSTTNFIAIKIKGVLYDVCEKEFFKDMIEDNQFNEQAFFKHTPTDIPKNIKKENIEIIDYHEDFYSMYKMCKPFGFSMLDITDFAKVTIIFNNISRNTSMQINRHRNAISQESQRYVKFSADGSNTINFIDPAKFNSNINKKYHIKLFDHDLGEVSISDIGNKLVKVYYQLSNQGVAPQDARSLLPSNVSTREMVTFTLRDLYHFLLVRDSKAAQHEIQHIASQIHNAIKELSPSILEFDNYFISNCDIPIYQLEDDKYKEIDSEFSKKYEEE